MNIHRHYDDIILWYDTEHKRHSIWQLVLLSRQVTYIMYQSFKIAQFDPFRTSDASIYIDSHHITTQHSVTEQAEIATNGFLLKSTHIYLLS